MPMSSKSKCYQVAGLHLSSTGDVLYLTSLSGLFRAKLTSLQGSVLPATKTNANQTETKVGESFDSWRMRVLNTYGVSIPPQFRPDWDRERNKAKGRRRTDTATGIPATMRKTAVLNSVPTGGYCTQCRTETIHNVLKQNKIEYYRGVPVKIPDIKIPTCSTCHAEYPDGPTIRTISSFTRKAYESLMRAKRKEQKEQTKNSLWYLHRDVPGNLGNVISGMLIRAKSEGSARALAKKKDKLHGDAWLYESTSQCEELKLQGREAVLLIDQ